MAIISTAVGSILRISVQTGTDGAGNPVLANRSYNRVKPGVTDDAVFAVASAIAGLQAYPLQGVERVDQETLSESGV